MSKTYIGAHLSASNGYLAMGKEAVSLGANTFAFFTRNPRGGKAKDLDPKDMEALMEYMTEQNFGKLVAHAPYTMNLCSEKQETRAFGLEMLKDDLQRMEYLPGNYYNFHPGSHTGQGADRGIELIVEALNEAMWEDMHTTILLETMAGKGSEVGANFEEIKRIIDGVKYKEHIGVCLDTCHVWDGGMDIVNDAEGVFKAFDEIIGLDRLKAMHLNDSKNPFSSHKDRHECLGLGSIGVEGLKNMVCSVHTRDLPMILETPTDNEGYKKEIAMVKKWREEAEG